jgi:RNase P subunit RPR2
MGTKYLHLSAYTCDQCEGPVIAGSFGTRETEIARESALAEVGAICLSCGNQGTIMSPASVVRQFAPVEWSPKNQKGRRTVS